MSFCVLIQREIPSRAMFHGNLVELFLFGQADLLSFWQFELFGFLGFF